MANKKSFVLRIDEDTYKSLERWATDEFRSVNGQIEWIIQQKLSEAGRLKSVNKEAADKKKKS
ncbi:MAG: hypothetical protein KGZ59_08085 [Chitinophagaceae bacterium]|nr:hypothetical protein [Chitinophagaceae bacterium]